MSAVNWKLSALRVNRAELPVIIEAARYGDSFAYDELVSRCYQPVLRFCASMGSPSDAHDLAQETFLRALKSTSITTEVTNLEAFMIHIARCVCADFIRELGKARQLHAAMKAYNAQEHMGTDEISSIECEQALTPLSPNMREAFVLTQLLGFSYEEVAQIVSAPIGTVRSRVSRARQILQLSQNSQALNLHTYS